MPHVDDGTLHALIDGALAAEDAEAAARVEAHLASCEDCRARLDQAAELRTAAGDLLAAAAPSAEPDFADVLARAGTKAERGVAGPPGRRTSGNQPRWTRRLSWAATIIVALGTGYLIRGLADPAGPVARDGVETLRAPDPVADAEPLGRGSAGSRSEEGAATAETGMADADGEDTTPAGSPSTGSDQESAPVTERAEADPSLADAPDRETEGRRASATAAEVPAERFELSAPIRRAEPAPELAADLARQTEAESAAVSSQESDVAGSLDKTAVDQEATGVGQRWTAATVAEAAARLEGPVYVLPRATVEAVYVGADGARVLSLQRTESGIPVEVVQRKDSAGDDGLPDRPETTERPFRELPDVERAVVRRDGFVLELSAALPADLLAILAESARPASGP